ncbi:hypothetical protein RvY_10722 [Ramazzottius varieornatus]|uniref:Uncharacterized protein n=1 Tax=Ramazzottius varieornatus TaxID=947166 RepID=A0A1D1VFR2_RAMVA|nr:hypothetical protein RvY_10722 [Ramazzottius varieornatus]
MELPLNDGAYRLIMCIVFSKQFRKAGQLKFSYSFSSDEQKMGFFWKFAKIETSQGKIVLPSPPAEAPPTPQDRKIVPHPADLSPTKRMDDSPERQEEPKRRKDH